MAIALFDLDNTLTTEDSDFLWGQYLINHKIVDASAYEEKNRLFYEDYEQGTLDIDRYLRFALQPLTQFPMQQLEDWRQAFVDEYIRPVIAPKAESVIAHHRDRGDIPVLISATNFFITEPIGQLLGFEHNLSTRPEIIDDRYSGNYLGKPTFQQGKVDALNLWLEESGQTLEESSFYTDSHNDLPLMEQVTYPYAVNPDPILTEIATKKGWPILDFRQ